MTASPRLLLLSQRPVDPRDLPAALSVEVIDAPSSAAPSSAAARAAARTATSCDRVVIAGDAAFTEASLRGLFERSTPPSESAVVAFAGDGAWAALSGTRSAADALRALAAPDPQTVAVPLLLVDHNEEPGPRYGVAVRIGALAEDDEGASPAAGAGALGRLVSRARQIVTSAERPAVTVVVDDAPVTVTAGVCTAAPAQDPWTRRLPAGSGPLHLYRAGSLAGLREHGLRGSVSHEQGSRVRVAGADALSLDGVPLAGGSLSLVSVRPGPVLRVLRGAS